MAISRSQKLIFIHIPKTAGTSIIKQLKIGPQDHYDWKLHMNKYPVEWNLYKSFAVVRNPFDRLVSNYEFIKMDVNYHHNIQKNKNIDYDICKQLSFEQVIDILLDEKELPITESNINYNRKLKHIGWKSQHLFICDDNLKIMVNHVLKYENLQQQLKELKICNHLLKINTSTRKSYEQYYNPSLLEKCKQLYKIDFELFYPELL